jgi:hypothetical protein
MEKDQVPWKAVRTSVQVVQKGTYHSPSEHIVESRSMFPPFFVKDHVNMFMVESIQAPKSDLLTILASYSTNPNTLPQGNTFSYNMYDRG